MPKTTVRVRMFADPIEVDADEIPLLRSQGLLIEDPAAELTRARDAAAAEVERLDALIAPEPEPTKPAGKTVKET